MHLAPYSTLESIADLNRVLCPWPIHKIEKAAYRSFLRQGRFEIISIFHDRTVTRSHMSVPDKPRDCRVKPKGSSMLSRTQFWPITIHFFGLPKNRWLREEPVLPTGPP